MMITFALAVDSQPADVTFGKQASILAPRLLENRSVCPPTLHKQLESQSSTVRPDLCSNQKLWRGLITIHEQGAAQKWLG